ncbi:MAG: TetR family transcriptional regulator C-terminal domain-containing protein [Pseudomonadota bacterium]
MKEDIRDRILMNGLPLMAERGFNGVGIKDIVAAAGVPKGSFYYYFDSKDAFSVAAVQAYAAEGAFMRAKFLSDQTQPPLDRIKAYFEALVDLFAAKSFREGCFLGAMGTETADHSEGVREALDSSFRLWREDIARTLQEAAAAGDIPIEIDPQDLADLLINGWEGALIRMKVEKRAAPLHQFLRVFWRMVQMPMPLRPEIEPRSDDIG